MFVLIVTVIGLVGFLFYAWCEDHYEAPRWSTKKPDGSRDLLPARPMPKWIEGYMAFCWCALYAVCLVGLILLAGR